MKKKEKFILTGIFFRYFLIILASINSLFIFYFLFSTVTIKLSYFLIDLFAKISLSGDSLVSWDYVITIVQACVAGSAYYLLFILNLSTPKITIKNRIKIFLFSSIAFLSLNIIRITMLAFLFLNYPSYFEIIHKLFWYLLSIVFVVGIWFACVKLFKIGSIPIYSDIKSINNLR